MYKSSLGVAIYRQLTIGRFHRYKPILSICYHMHTQCCLRFEPSSRTTLMGEQPNPWNVLPLQDVMSRHRNYVKEMAKLIKYC